MKDPHLFFYLQGIVLVYIEKIKYIWYEKMYRQSALSKLLSLGWYLSMFILLELLFAYYQN